MLIDIETFDCSSRIRVEHLRKNVRVHFYYSNKNCAKNEIIDSALNTQPEPLNLTSNYITT